MKKRLQSLALLAGLAGLAYGLTLLGLERGHLQPAAAAALIAAAILSLWFRKTRRFLATLILGMAWFFASEQMQALGLQTLEGQGLWAAVFMLLPANWLLLLILPERKIASVGSVSFMAFAMMQFSIFSVLGPFWSLDMPPAQSIPGSDILTYGTHAVPAPAVLVLFLSAVPLFFREVLQPSFLHRTFVGLWLLLVMLYFQGASPYHGLSLAILSGIWISFSIVMESYQMSYMDELTEIPGRRALREDLQRCGPAFAAAMVDIDHFKKFNDTHGHDVGDDVLRLVASMLLKTDGAQAYRYGGEEFTLLFAGRELKAVREPLEAVREAIEKRTFVVRGSQRALKVTVSIGAAGRSGEHPDPMDVLKAADQALYKAKERGRNMVVLAGDRRRRSKTSNKEKKRPQRIKKK